MPRPLQAQAFRVQTVSNLPFAPRHTLERLKLPPLTSPRPPRNDSFRMGSTPSTEPGGSRKRQKRKESVNAGAVVERRTFSAAPLKQSSRQPAIIVHPCGANFLTSEVRARSLCRLPAVFLSAPQSTPCRTKHSPSIGFLSLLARLTRTSRWKVRPRNGTRSCYGADIERHVQT